MGAREADRQTANGGGLPSASPLARLRLTLTGLAGPIGLGYSASAEYVTADRGPHTAGPALSPVTYRDHPDLVPPPERLPIDQLRVFFALRYDFLDSSAASDGGMK